MSSVLRVLPEGADRKLHTLLLVLYGFLALAGRSPVTAPALLRSARESGLRIARAHLLLEKHPHLVRMAGHRRGVRYRLTQAGVEYCEKLVRTMRRELEG